MNIKSIKNITGLDAHTIAELNVYFTDISKENPVSLILWALERSNRPLLSTNFRPYESVILHACTKAQESLKTQLPIIWCDTGYNTRQTYLHKIELEKLLTLSISTYVPQYSTAYINVLFNGIPEVDTEEHTNFTKIVKLEPFHRAMQEHSPDLWFTNLRKTQTEHRQSLNIFSYSADGVLKLSPFFHWSDEELDEYLHKYNLPNENQYFDPTKVLENRECGLHK